MTKLEILMQEIADAGIEVIPYQFIQNGVKGFYISTGHDSQKVILIDKNIISDDEKYCILAEEFAHSQHNVGNVTKDNQAENYARRKSYDKSIGLKGLIDAYEHHCIEIYDYMDYLNVTYEYLMDCIEAYRIKYGIEKLYKGYRLQFIPNFYIEKLENI